VSGLGLCSGGLSSRGHSERSESDTCRDSRRGTAPRSNPVPARVHRGWPLDSGSVPAHRTPNWHMFMLPMSWKRAGKSAGKSACPPTRATATTPSSSGCLSDSSTERGNSGSSSRRRTPWCPSVRECLLSPGVPGQRELPPCQVYGKVKPAWIGPQEVEMSALVLYMSMSLDGYIAGPNDETGQPRRRRLRPAA
jgi:hypothetical protein